MIHRDELWLSDDTRGRGPSVETVVVYLVVPLFLTLVSAPYPDPREWLRAYAVNFIVGVCVAGTMQASYALVWPRLLTRRPAWPGQAGAHLVTVLFAVLAGGEVAIRLTVFLWDFDPARARASIHRVSLVVTLSLLTLLLVYDRLRARARASEEAAQAARLAAVRAQLDALVARTNPHFLFNSLNSVAALIPEDAARAEAMLERLSALFRYALEGARRPEVSLAEEVATARDYLEIEAIRFGERLGWSVEVAAGLDDAAVPPLCLQPLVENAILHGVAPRRGPGRVEVRVERHGDRLTIRVEDDGEAGGGSGGSRSALADLRTRLALLHGDAATLHAGPRDGGGWCARVELPLRRLARAEDAAS